MNPADSDRGGVLHSDLKRTKMCSQFSAFPPTTQHPRVVAMAAGAPIMDPELKSFLYAFISAVPASWPLPPGLPRPVDKPTIQLWPTAEFVKLNTFPVHMFDHVPRLKPVLDILSCFFAVDRVTVLLALLSTLNTAIMDARSARESESGVASKARATPSSASSFRLCAVDSSRRDSDGSEVIVPVQDIIKLRCSIVGFEAVVMAVRMDEAREELHHSAPTMRTPHAEGAGSFLALTTRAGMGPTHWQYTAPQLLHPMHACRFTWWVPFQADNAPALARGAVHGCGWRQLLVLWDAARRRLVCAAKVRIDGKSVHTH